jgi:hypothetical protein
VRIKVQKLLQTYEISQGRYLPLITRESPAQTLAFSSAAHTSPPGMNSLRDAETGLHLDDRVELCCDQHSNNDVGRAIVPSAT